MRRKILIALASLPLWLLVAEGGLRLALRLKGSPYSGLETRAWLADVQQGIMPIPGMDDSDGLVQRERVQTGIHPYFGWEVVSDQISGEVARYLSGEWDSTYEVLIVGGSVAALTAARGGSVILEELRKDPGINGRLPRVLNHGRGSFKQPQMTMKVAYLFDLGYEPDAVVLIDGFNEVALGANNVAVGVDPVHPHWGYYGPHAGGRARDRDQLRRYARSLRIEDAITAEIQRAIRWKWTKSAILGRFVEWRVSTLRAEWSEVQDGISSGAGAEGDTGEGASDGEEGGARDPARGDRFLGTPQQAMQRIVRSWEQSSIQLGAICKARGIPFLHVLQPTLYDEGSKPLTEKELESAEVKPTWRKGVELGYPMLREAAPRLEAAGVTFIDGSDTFKELEEPTYYDACHFRGKGMRMFAARIGEELVRLSRERTDR